MICDSALGADDSLSFPPIMESNHSIQITNSFLPSPFSADPIVPNAVGLQHLHAAAVTHSLFDLIMSQTDADLPRQVRQLKAERGSLGYMLLQLCEVDLC